MRLARIALRLSVGFALVFGFLLVHSSSSLADDTATITIHKAECPTGVGSQIFEKCHSNGLGGVSFAIGPDGAESIYTTDDSGVIGPITVPAGHINIVEDPATVSQYLGEYVYCRDLNTDTVLFDSDLSGTIGLHGSNPAGSNVVCDWYDITPAASNGGDTGGSTVTAATLPSTGIGAPSNETFPFLPTTAFLALVTLVGAYGLRRR